MANSKVDSRKRRHSRIRKIVSGTEFKPRLSVFRSLNHIYAQIIDDEKGVTIVSASSHDSSLKELKEHRGNVKTARKVGAIVAQKAIEKGIRKVVFDRGGYRYHGRVKALSDAAREAGLEF